MIFKSILRIGEWTHRVD